MIGIFDSGHGGLTVLQVVAAQFPHLQLVYLGDHGHAPYGNKSAAEVLALTTAGVETLFQQGCQLVILACNTATAIAARTLQQDWLPASGWQAKGYKVLGIVAPTVEAATHTPWAVTTPQYPQKNNTDTMLIFGTVRTIESGVYPEEIRKRCPKITVIQQACPHLVAAIEGHAPEAEIELLVQDYTHAALKKCAVPPHSAILGCTHYPLVEHLFRAHLPASTRVLSQPTIVAHSLEDYLHRHPQFAQPINPKLPHIQYLTTGKPAEVTRSLAQFWQGDVIDFTHI
ncbi:MAG: aspartate/glutamate racemase family protein [Alphaproteobacteria bacterium]